MTGESLMNNSFDAVGKQLAQGAAGGIDRLFGNVEILIVVGVFILGYYLLRGR